MVKLDLTFKKLMESECVNNDRKREEERTRVEICIYISDGVFCQTKLYLSGYKFSFVHVSRIIRKKANTKMQTSRFFCCYFEFRNRLDFCEVSSPFKLLKNAAVKIKADWIVSS